MNGEESEESIRINNFRYKAILDTGSSVNVITEESLGRLESEELLIEQREGSLRVIDGTKIKVDRRVLLTVTTKGNKIKDWFWILKKGVVGVLIGNPLIKRLKDTKPQEESDSKVRCFPVVCPIETSDKEIISWTRPIRSVSEKQEFQKLVKDLENRGIVEKSTSIWLNPIVLVRKDTGKLRFCLDLRRLNNLVKLDEFEMPNVQEIIQNVHGKKFFTHIDLKDGFFQVPLRTKDR